ncbi:MAG: calcium/sodium antiporter [Bacteroidaceae bacterium]|jgi:cation:H+ antiporter|nr:calcium/sodium antiporter [Bacteroidaceae bacterium]MEE1004626.1 calcium/sodium antiporter [Bacteroidaceae bacterium]
MEYIILIVSLIGIVFSADLLVGGAVSIARKYKVSDFVIGAAIVGVGTSMPEFVVSFLGALNGNADVAIGNVVGSNIFNVLGILGITAIFFPIAVDRKNMRFELPLCIFVSVLLLLLTFNCFNGSASSLARLDGILLLLVFALYMLYSFARDRKEAAVAADNGDGGSLWKAVLKVVGGLALLITSCDFFVDNAVSVAKSFGVDNAFISLTLIACGTSLPELAASVAAAVKKNTDMALGNIVGSNIFNITLILGLSSQVMPLTSSGITYIDYIVMIAATVLLFVIGLFGRIGRLSGLLMFICFVLYNWYLVSNQMA